MDFLFRTPGFKTTSLVCHPFPKAYRRLLQPLPENFKGAFEVDQSDEQLLQQPDDAFSQEDESNQNPLPYGNQPLLQSPEDFMDLLLGVVVVPESLDFPGCFLF